MANRAKYLIPAVSALSLAVAPGCADPIIGIWDVVMVAGEDVPYTYSLYDLAEVTVTSKGMEFGEELDGQVEMEFAFNVFGVEYSVDYDWDVKAEVVKKRKEYNIEIEDYALSDVELTCTMEKRSVLDCVDEDELVWAFEKLEE